MARAYNHLDVDETIDFYRQASNSGTVLQYFKALS
jgi:hypothetical protein